MKNVYEVLRQKELELARLEKEVEALRVTAPLLADEEKDSLDASRPTLVTAAAGPPIRTSQPTINAAGQPARAAGWEDSTKRWP
jgi:hypothetical protein